LRRLNVRTPKPPSLDPFPTLTTAEVVTLRGIAQPRATVEITAPAGRTVVGTASDGSFVVDVPLVSNRVNRILLVTRTRSARADAVYGNPDLRSFPAVAAITQDTEPPTLFVDFPAPGSVIADTTTSVAGRVGDLLSGDSGLRVFVNGIEAIVDVGDGNNGTFFVEDVPLDGPTVLDTIAEDAVGNTTSREVLVRSEVPTGPRMQKISGDAQSGEIQTVLPDPIVIELLEADGTPFADKSVTFSVIRSDGLISSTPGGEGVFVLQTRTDMQGRAQVFWTLGSDAGCGNNRILVSSAGVVPSATFCATARPGPPSQISVDSGFEQSGEAGEEAPAPLRVWVHDRGNGIAGVSVTFTVVAGGGLVGGQSSTVVSTDATGHAQTTLSLGPSNGNNVVEADFPGNPGLPATFTVFGIARDPASGTSFSGVVVSNSSTPIEGASCVLAVGDVSMSTSSNENGEFRFDEIIASGPGDLLINGTTAFAVSGEQIPQRSFPSLHYEPVLVPNAENSLPIPVLLPPLDPANEVSFDNTRTVALTVDGVEGLRMIVEAGSMTRPDGTVPAPGNPEVIALNIVHNDDLPMALPNGGAALFAWTLQPAGARFDPPVRIEFPNLSGLPAGQLTNILTFNHDTGRFEIVSSGAVSSDGSRIVSDPGSGIRSAGWGSSVPRQPPATGDVTRKCGVIIAAARAMCTESQITLAAFGQPGGGTYSWQQTAGTAAMIDGATDQPSITVKSGMDPSAAKNDIAFQCTYTTPEGDICDATHTLTVFEVEITDFADNEYVSPVMSERVAVRTELRARVKPSDAGARYQWTVEGTHVKVYEHDIDEAAKHVLISLAAADLRAKDVKLFWRNEGSHGVRVVVNVDGIQCEDDEDFELALHDDPNIEVYAKDDDEERTPNGEADTYAMLESHGNWHLGDPMDNGDDPVGSAPEGYWGDEGPSGTPFGADYNGSAFLDWHRAFLDAHLAWRNTFNVGAFRIPGGLATEPMPSYLMRAPAATADMTSRLYGYVRLGEFQDLDELGRDVVHPWHNFGHGRIAEQGFPKMDDVRISPCAMKDVFWHWHTIVDGPRASHFIDQAAILSTIPADGDVLGDGPTEIIVAFDKKVSFGAPSRNTVQIKKEALKVNGVVATDLEDAGGATSKFMIYKFTIQDPGSGTVTVELTGTASYEGKTWEFEVQ